MKTGTVSGCSEELSGSAKEASELSAKDNILIMRRIVKDWMLGPKEATVEVKANKAYWTKIASTWDIDEAEARRQLCANCEYAINRPEVIKAMEHIPNNKFDMDGGGRVWCKKFDFICHNLRTCQSWEAGY